MDPLDLILTKLEAGWYEVVQYLEDPMAMFVFVALLILVSLTLINRDH